MGPTDAKNIANDEVLYSERDLKEYEYDVDQKSRIGIPLRGKLHSKMKKVKKKKGSCLEIQATSDDQLLNEQLFKNKTAIEKFEPDLLRTKLWKNSGHVLNESYVNPFNSKDLSPLKAPLLDNYEKNNAKKAALELLKEEDINNLLKSLNKLINEDGRIIITTPNFSSIFVRFGSGLAKDRSIYHVLV